MKTMLNVMKKAKNGVSDDTVAIFEGIMKAYAGPGSKRVECENKFMEAIGVYFTEEERFRLWEQDGGCKGTGQDPQRKAFAAAHKGESLAMRFAAFVDTYETGFTGKTRDITLDEEKRMITVTFGCDECYKHTAKGKYTEPYALRYERCAGGRMYGLEKTLGIKLRIQAVTVPEDWVSKEQPCVFTYRIEEGLS